MSLTRKSFASIIAFVLAVALTGCSGSSAPSTPEPDDQEGAGRAPGDRITRDTLPTEPGYAWDVARYAGTDPIPVQMTVEGPWVLGAADDWVVTTTEIVEPDSVPEIGAFDDFDFVVKAPDGATDYYYPRRVTDEWMLQLGKITVNGTDVIAEPYADPLRFWPVDFGVGDEFVVADGGSFRIDATVLAKSVATVPAGEIDDAYLLRFEYTPLTEGAIEGTHYYILAPEVGFVALFSVAEGDEESGFTALASEQVLISLPQKR